MEEARTRGFEIAGLKQADMIAMLAEAGQKQEPSLGERLGWIRGGALAVLPGSRIVAVIANRHIAGNAHSLLTNPL